MNRFAHLSLRRMVLLSRLAATASTPEKSVPPLERSFAEMLCDTGACYGHRSALFTCANTLFQHTLEIGEARCRPQLQREPLAAQCPKTSALETARDTRRVGKQRAMQFPGGKYRRCEVGRGGKRWEEVGSIEGQSEVHRHPC